jgi:hypothetical protein
MASYIAGQASIQIDGQSFLLVGEFAYTLPGFAVETLTGVDGVHGPKGSAKPGNIKAKLRDSGQIDTQTLTDGTSVSVVCQLANGKLVAGNNMWRVGDPVTVNTDDATLDVAWEGIDISESTF